MNPRLSAPTTRSMFFPRNGLASSSTASASPDGVGQQRRDVAEQDPGLGEVRDVADELFQRRDRVGHDGSIVRATVTRANVQRDGAVEENVDGNVVSLRVLLAQLGERFGRASSEQPEGRTGVHESPASLASAVRLQRTCPDRPRQPRWGIGTWPCKLHPFRLRSSGAESCTGHSVEEWTERLPGRPEWSMSDRPSLSGRNRNV